MKRKRTRKENLLGRQSFLRRHVRVSARDGHAAHGLDVAHFVAGRARVHAAIRVVGAADGQGGDAVRVQAEGVLPGGPDALAVAVPSGRARRKAEEGKRAGDKEEEEEKKEKEKMGE